MNAKRNKKTLTAGALSAVLAASLSLTGCGFHHHVMPPPPPVTVAP
ncbi:hypothetical protein [Mycobacterium sp.]|nr:hypothetical protein [Mycobacterium sp.]